MFIDKSDLNKDLEQVVSAFKKELASIRTGNANPEDISHIQVEAYEGFNPLSSVGQVISEDAMTLKVSVWDKNILPNVEKALREANLSGSIAIDRDNIRINFSPMTQEDREIRVKQLKDITENFKIRVRQVRQKFMKELDSLEGVSLNELERDKKHVQEDIDRRINEIQELFSKKEQELLKI